MQVDTFLNLYLNHERKDDIWTQNPEYIHSYLKTGGQFNLNVLFYDNTYLIFPGFMQGFMQNKVIVSLIG